MSQVQPRKALITGVSGQDGAYLADLLLRKGYLVFGTSRNVENNNFDNLLMLGIKERIKIIKLELENFEAVKEHFNSELYDEVYHLAGESSVGQSFVEPYRSMIGSQLAVINILETARIIGMKSRFFFAGSSECFGDTGLIKADEQTPLAPKSPYGVAKSANYFSVRSYRNAYGLHASTGILFNHESSLRPERFVTSKIINAACRISRGMQSTLELGDLTIKRDWGWAPEFVIAMWKMVQQDSPSDYVIATGETNSLEDFVNCAFNCVGLDWKNHVVTQPKIYRPAEIMESRANPLKAQRELGWKAKYKLKDVVSLMISNAAEFT